ncbi:hypothetical protein CXF33_09320, partial [Corynebacterium bovis]
MPRSPGTRRGSTTCCSPGNCSGTRCARRSTTGGSPPSRGTPAAGGHAGGHAAHPASSGDDRGPSGGRVRSRRDRSPPPSS